MEKQLSKATNLIKKNPTIMAAVVVAVILTVGVVAYGQSNKSALQRKQLETDAKLASQIEDSKKANEAREAKIVAQKKAAKVEAEKKAAAEKAAAEAAAKKAAEEAAAVAAAAYTAEKTYTYTEKEKEKPSYTEVGVSLSKSGSTLTALIAVPDSGTCYFQYKKYVNGEKVYGEGSSPAAGSCTHTMSGDGWEYVSVTYKSSDYTKKGWASL